MLLRLRFFKSTVIFGLLFALLALQPVNAEETFYDIESIVLEVEVDEKGNLHITEYATYDFQGEFNGVLLDFNTNGSDGLAQFQAFEIKEQQEWSLPFEQAREEDHIQLKVYAPSINERKLFKFTYSFMNVVQVYADTAELYWKFFDEMNTSRIDEVNVNVKLPKGVKAEDILAFGHGPTNGKVTILEHADVQFQAKPLQSGELFELRVLFPIQYVASSSNSTDVPMLSTILEEESNWAAVDQVKKKAYSLIVLAAALIVNTAAGYVVFRRYGRSHKPAWKGKYYRDLPSHTAPAIVSYLVDFKIESRDLMATLTDLVRRNYASIHVMESPANRAERKEYIYRLLHNETEGLLQHEITLINWFFYKLGQNGEVKLSDIQAAAKSKKSAKRFKSQFESWKGEVLEAIHSLNYIEVKRRRIAPPVMAITAFIQFLCLFILMPEGWSWVAIAPAVLLCFMPKSKRRNEAGQTEYAKWKGFRQYIEDYSKISTKEPLAVHVWEHYFVYAISLGVANKMEKITRIKLSNQDVEHFKDSIDYAIYASWINSMQQTIAKGTEASSSDFSSGGGGGGGGGGRGAF